MWNPAPKFSLKPFWWWSKRPLSVLYSAPTSTTMSHSFKTLVSLERMTSTWLPFQMSSSDRVTGTPPDCKSHWPASRYATVCRKRNTARASSQWKVPSWVPMRYTKLERLAVIHLAMNFTEELLGRPISPVPRNNIICRLDTWDNRENARAQDCKMYICHTYSNLMHCTRKPKPSHIYFNMYSHKKLFDKVDV